LKPTHSFKLLKTQPDKTSPSNLPKWHHEHSYECLPSSVFSLYKQQNQSTVYTTKWSKGNFKLLIYVT